ncbi:hypothetical protein KAU11_07995 [Candidatus Babeliales bacterium]|nr:hypothetical protein [Candidatus Babeliales bacterium]
MTQVLGVHSKHPNQEGFQSFISTKDEMIDVPNTEIANRAKIVDPSRGVMASMGVDRVPTHQIKKIKDESGPNGESVFGVVGDRLNQIRFSGNVSPILGAGGDGQGVRMDSTNDFAEVTFYGTGLNILTRLSGSNRSLFPTVDGGAEGANIFSTGYASIINARGYSANQVLSVVSGLSLGTHTIKLRADTSVSNLEISGLEFLDESTQIKVNPGTSYVDGKKVELSAQQSLSYNSDFESGAIGTKGGCVLVYKDSSGAIKKSVTPTDASQLNLTSADHSNEELIRTINFREFGANRADDFSTITTGATDRIFTLDDGTTTLAGDDTYLSNFHGIEGHASEGGGINHHILTFVGTGLDVFLSSDGSDKSWDMIVDGTSIGTLSRNTFNNDAYVKIVSGLPYGTHTVKFLTNSASNGPSVIDYIIYAPKKPTLLANAMEVGSYYVMADYVQTTTPDHKFISQGVLRKKESREIVYNGSWTFGVHSPGTAAWDFDISTQALNAGYEYTFFGTGIELCDYTAANRSSNTTIQIDGVNYTGAATTEGNWVWTPGSSLLNMETGASIPSSISISGLSLGAHTIKIVNNVSGVSERVNAPAINIITPIHAQKFLDKNIQSALMIGSQSIADGRNLSAIKNDGDIPNYATALGVSSSPTTTSTSPVPMPDMQATVETSGNAIEVEFDASVINSNSAATVSIKIFVDGIEIGEGAAAQSTGNYPFSLSKHEPIEVDAGVHIVQLFWSVSSGTGTAWNRLRSLTVKEMK